MITQRRFALLASCCALLAALWSMTPRTRASPTPTAQTLSRRRNIVVSCNKAGGRCIYAPNTISVRSQDIVESGQIDNDHYVALLSSGAASGFAFGNCINSPKTDNVNWAFTSTTGGGKQLATCSGNKDNNVLIEAFFSDNSSKVMSGRGTIVSDIPFTDLHLRCKGGRVEAEARTDPEAKNDDVTERATTDLAPRARLADQCGQPLARCIFAPTFIHLATDDVVKSEAIDADSYVALLTQGAALGSAFGKCDGHTQDAIDWQYSAAKVPAGQRPLALASGNDHNNTLIRAYFSDNPGKVMSGGGSIVTNADSADLKIACGSKANEDDDGATDVVDTRAVTPTTGLARRASLADSCNQPDARCIFAPKFVSIQSKDIVQEEEVDGNTYVVLLAKHAAKGTAFGICSTAQGSDTIDWQFTQAQVPAGQKPIAVVSGNDHNNVLLKAYFSDRPNQIMVGKGSVVTNAVSPDLTIEC